VRNPLPLKRERILFISFEGIDKSGKTTQTSLLAQYLKERGHRVVKTSEPGGTKLGTKVKEILLGPSHSKMSKISELFLYLADRAEHVEKIIKPALVQGKIVISDRFGDATLAYQGYGRGLEIEWIEELNRIATQGILPDITFLLDINPSLARQRGVKKDRMEQEGQNFHQRVYQGYLELAKSHPERIKIVPGKEPPQSIHLTIKEILSPYLRAHEQKKNSPEKAHLKRASIEGTENVI
jgi:dTMP kinase